MTWHVKLYWSDRPRHLDTLEMYNFSGIWIYVCLKSKANIKFLNRFRMVRFLPFFRFLVNIGIPFFSSVYCQQYKLEIKKRGETNGEWNFWGKLTAFYKILGSGLCAYQILALVAITIQFFFSAAAFRLKVSLAKFSKLELVEARATKWHRALALV